jgi:hypothetical protein
MTGSSTDNKAIKFPARALLAERLQEADSKSKSKTTTVTLRIPTELNDWLDEYRHLSYPQRIEKQSLVIEGLRLLYMARGQPGTEAFDLEEVLLAKTPGRGLSKSKRK